MIETENKIAIAYYRVSTRKQGRSGLGLEAQQYDVGLHVAKYDLELMAEYTEVESGKNPDRPVLKRAMGHVKRAKGLLVIAKLDRLARNVAFTSAVMASKVNFVCCDQPFADTFTIHILAANAQREQEDASSRTKAGLDRRKAKGLPMGANVPGCVKLTDELRKKGRAAAVERRRRDIQEAYEDLVPELRELLKTRTIQNVVDILNKRGEVTRTGRPWDNTRLRAMCGQMEIEIKTEIIRPAPASSSPRNGPQNQPGILDFDEYWSGQLGHRQE